MLERPGELHNVTARAGHPCRLPMMQVWKPRRGFSNTVPNENTAQIIVLIIEELTDSAFPHTTDGSSIPHM